MASSSSPVSYSYDVFPSFCGKDVRQKFRSHLLEALNGKMIVTFIDNEIRAGQLIGPKLKQAIKESKISLVILSENYASSRWCLDELLEVKKFTAKGNVMTIFYEVSPSDVRNQRGAFGKCFDITCMDKTENQKTKWRQALVYVAEIAGVESRKWPNEAEMVKKVTNNIFNQLRKTPASECDDLVGIDHHLEKTKLLLCQNPKEVKMVGIWGPAGIGKTTIARVLYNQLFNDFHQRWFIENVRGNYKVPGLGIDSLKLRLQNRLLSKDFKENDMNMLVAGNILKDRKVLLVLDDVDKLDQLDALAKANWFGPGSRIIVTTEDLQLLKSHKIKHIYKVDFPSNDEAFEIFCQSAFGKKSPPDGFPADLLAAAANLTHNLPLALTILGTSLRGTSIDDWKYKLCQTDHLRDVTNMLKMGYESLLEAEKELFLLIACLFNGEDEDNLRQLVEDLSCKLSVLSNKALIRKTNDGFIVMHYLLQQLGINTVSYQSGKPGERKFLTHAGEIHDVLIHNTGSENVVGISLDISLDTPGSGQHEKMMIRIEEDAFKKMFNLQYLRIYKNYGEVKQHLYLPNGLIQLPSKLRLLHWDACPIQCIPNTFSTQFLVQLKLRGSQIEKLWEEEQPMIHLKQVDLSESLKLENISGLTNAINLEEMYLNSCQSLEELPTSLNNLTKLKVLDMRSCTNLKVFHKDINLTSLSFLYLDECSKLRNFPDISTNIIGLYMRNAKSIEEVPPSIEQWRSLSEFCLSGCENLTKFPDVPSSIKELYLCRTGIEEIPPWIRRLSLLQKLWVKDCKKLKTIPQSISELKNIEEMSFSGCKNVKSFPEDIFLPSCILGLEDVRDGSICIPEDDGAQTVSLFLSKNEFKKLPYGIGRLSKLRRLVLTDCQNLESLPELPNSLVGLHVENCSSLRSISSAFLNPASYLMFVNCLNLEEDAKQLIQQAVCRYTFLPVEKVPPHFTHRALGSSLTIDLGDTNTSRITSFEACVVLRKVHTYNEISDVRVSCSFTSSMTGVFQCDWPVIFVPPLQTDHLFIVKSVLSLAKIRETENQVQVKFNCICDTDSTAWEIRECGIHEDERRESDDNSSQISDSDSDSGYETAFSYSDEDIDL